MKILFNFYDLHCVFRVIYFVDNFANDFIIRVFIDFSVTIVTTTRRVCIYVKYVYIKRSFATRVAGNFVK